MKAAVEALAKRATNLLKRCISKMEQQVHQEQAHQAQVLRPVRKSLRLTPISLMRSLKKTAETADRIIKPPREARAPLGGFSCFKTKSVGR